MICNGWALGPRGRDAFQAMSGTTNNPEPLQRLLDESLQAGASGDWVGACVAALDAIYNARQRLDFAGMSRAIAAYRKACAEVIQEAERAGGGAMIIARGADAPDPLRAGCYLLQPPMIGADAARLREAAFAGRLPVRVLAREPMTRDGHWPVVAVGDVIVRTKVVPPEQLERVEGAITKDAYPGPAPLDWFRAAIESLGETALSRLDADEPAQHRVDDLLEILSALPEHPSVLDALESACAEAQEKPAPTLPRRRPVIDDPYSF